MSECQNDLNHETERIGKQVSDWSEVFRHFGITFHVLNSNSCLLDCPTCLRPKSIKFTKKTSRHAYACWRCKACNCQRTFFDSCVGLIRLFATYSGTHLAPVDILKQIENLLLAETIKDKQLPPVTIEYGRFKGLLWSEVDDLQYARWAAQHFESFIDGDTLQVLRECFQIPEPAAIQ